MDKEKFIKSNQEQAVASWIDYLNQIRIDNLLEALHDQDQNLDKAMWFLDEALDRIHNDVIAINRGGDRGGHGFIAEIAQWGVENAEYKVNGLSDSIKWVDDNGPTDLIRNVDLGGVKIQVDIQQKFYNSALSIDAIEKHLEKYPDYIKNGGKYMIPQDQYDKIMKYADIPEKVAKKMPTSDGSFNYKQWEMVQDFKKNSKIGLDNLEPSDLKYAEVQKGKIDKTIAEKKEGIKEEDSNIRKGLYDDSKPTFKEGAKATAVSGLIECSTTFAIELGKKIKKKHGIKNLDKKDWEEIGKKSGYGLAKGSVRGAVTYSLSNYTATPAAMASAVATSMFSVGEQVYAFNKGEISEVTMIEQSELLCLDAIMSAVTSLVGQYFIPIPILGAIIGNSFGMALYSNIKNTAFERQREIIDGYIEDLMKQKTELEKDYIELAASLEKAVFEFLEICAIAFSDDIETAFFGSVKLATSMGVDPEEILDTREKIDAYFMD